MHLTELKPGKEPVATANGSDVGELLVTVKQVHVDIMVKDRDLVKANVLVLKVVKHRYFVVCQKSIILIRYMSEHWVAINISNLNNFLAMIVNAETLVEHGVLRKKTDSLRILGNGEINVPLTVNAQHFSAVSKSKN